MQSFTSKLMSNNYLEEIWDAICTIKMLFAQYQMRCYGCVFNFPNTKIREKASCVTLFDVPSINILQ